MQNIVLGPRAPLGQMVLFSFQITNLFGFNLRNYVFLKPFFLVVEVLIHH